jgi:hypothetical protein
MGGLTKQLALGILLGLSLAACAGVSFPYKYYGIDLPENKFRGPTEQDDEDISRCLPTATDKSPCTGMFTEIFLEMKKDYIETKNQLITCQQQLAAK